MSIKAPPSVAAPPSAALPDRSCSTPTVLIVAYALWLMTSVKINFA